jgi:hypothetical protein
LAAIGPAEDLREKVVNNVVLNNAVEEVAADKAKLAVNSGQSTLDKGPVLGIIVRHLHVSVVKVSDGN